MIGRFIFNHRLMFFICFIILSLLGYHYLGTNYDFKIRQKVSDFVRERPAPSSPYDPVSEPEPLRAPKVHSWAYYIKDPSIDKMRASNFDLIVTDVGSDTIKRFSREQIESIQKTGNRVVAFLSLGAAENYRDYWETAWFTERPEWMKEENKFWRGNFRVENLLHKDWMRITRQQIDQVMNAGFDGIMINGINSPEAVPYLKLVHSYIKERDSKFMIFVQDYVDPAIAPYVDGIVKQNIYYYYGRKLQNNVESMTEKLRDFINKDKIVLAVSYTTGSRWEKVKTDLKALGIVPYSGPVQLDVLRTDQ